MQPTAVLLPGNMCDARLWHGGDNALRRVLADAGIAAVADADLTQDDTIAAMATRTLANGDGPLLAIGFSMGAIVAVDMWMQAPQRIIGLILLGYNATADLPARAIHRPAQQAEVRAGGLERVLVEELKPNYLAAAHRGSVALLALLRDMGMALGEDVFLRQSEALRLRADRQGALSAITVPVLFGCGREDALCPPAWHEQWLLMTPHARASTFDGAGHMLPLEAPAALAHAISNWINDHRGTLFP